MTNQRESDSTVFFRLAQHRYPCRLHDSIFFGGFQDDYIQFKKGDYFQKLLQD